MTKITTDEYFGGCPQCGKCAGTLNIGRVHWCACDEHRTKWCIGENLFSAWRNESEEVWQRNAEILAGYEDVNPVYPPVSTCRRCGAQTIGSIEFPHSVLCRIQPDGYDTPLSDETVAQALKIIHDSGHHITQNASGFGAGRHADPDSEIPF